MRIIPTLVLFALSYGVCAAQGGIAVKTLDIAVAGDLLDHLVGTVSTDDGAGVEVISNGTQHVRATVGVDRVSLKVLDYYGGSAAGINEYDGAYGAGRLLKSGDTVSGEVKLRLIPAGR